MMQNSVLKIGPKDNVSIALTDLHKGERITYSDHVYILTSDVPAKHMFGTQDLSAGDDVVMYGVLVGKARHPIQARKSLVRHQAERYSESAAIQVDSFPMCLGGGGEPSVDTTGPMERSARETIGLVVPLVFCENRNIAVLTTFPSGTGFCSTEHLSATGSGTG